MSDYDDGYGNGYYDGFHDGVMAILRGGLTPTATFDRADVAAVVEALWPPKEDDDA